MAPPSKPSKLPPVLLASLGTGLTLLLALFFAWDLVDVLTPFLAPVPLLLMGAAFLIVLIWSLAHAVSSLRQRQGKGTVALGVNLIVLLLAWQLPFTTLRLDSDFRMKRARRMEVVRMVESGRLKPSPQGTAELPDGYRDLSDGGRIMVERRGVVTSVFFFTFRGVTDNYSGFIHRSDGQSPHPKDFGGDLYGIEQVEDRWFFVSAT